MYAGAAALIGGLLISRIMAERSLASLSADEKVALLDHFTRLRAYGSIPVVFVGICLIGLRRLPGPFMMPVFAAVVLLFASYVTWQHLFVQRRLRSLAICEPFIQAHRRAELCRDGGWLVFFITFGINLLS